MITSPLSGYSTYSLFFVCWAKDNRKEPKVTLVDGSFLGVVYKYKFFLSLYHKKSMFLLQNGDMINWRVNHQINLPFQTHRFGGLTYNPSASEPQIVYIICAFSLWLLPEP